MAYDRRIEFEGGNVADYIYFLEERVFELESIVNANIHDQTQIHSNHEESARDSSRAIQTPRSVEVQKRQKNSETDNRTPRSSRGETRLSSAGRRVGGDLNNLKIIEYRPVVDKNLSPNKRKRDNESKTAKVQHQMLLEFTSFVQNLPQSRAWKDWASVDDTQRARLLRGLLHGFAPPDDIKALHSQTSTPTQISIIQEYGSSMRASCTTIRQLTCFRELIFCSLCAVAVRSAANKDGVYEAMRANFRSDAYSKRFEALIRGAKWVNNAISLLSQTRWASRSYEIFLVAGHHVSFYAKFNDFSIKPEHLMHGLETEFLNSSYPQINTKTSITLAIPLIVKQIFKDCTSLPEICECLGYTCSEIETNCTPFGIIPQFQNSTEALWDFGSEVPNSPTLRHHQTRSHGSSIVRSREDHDMERNTDPRHSVCLEKHGDKSNDRHERIVNQNEGPPPLPPPETPLSGNDVYRSFGDLPRISESSGNLDGLSQSEPCDLPPMENNSGVGNTWFSTYLDPSLNEALREENIAMSDAWFSTFPNPQLGESMPQGGDYGTGMAWFSTYQNG